MCEYESLFCVTRWGSLQAVTSVVSLSTLTTTCASLTIHGWICLSFFTFTFYFSLSLSIFDNHLLFFDYSRVNLLIIFSLSLSILTTTCASSTIHGWISLSLFVACLFCNQFAITQTKYHSWAGMKTWPFNSVIPSWYFFNEKLSLIAIIFSVFYS